MDYNTKRPSRTAAAVCVTTDIRILINNSFCYDATAEHETELDMPTQHPTTFANNVYAQDGRRCHPPPVSRLCDVICGPTFRITKQNQCLCDNLLHCCDFVTFSPPVIKVACLIATSMNTRRESISLCYRGDTKYIIFITCSRW